MQKVTFKKSSFLLVLSIFIIFLSGISYFAYSSYHRGFERGFGTKYSDYQEIEEVFRNLKHEFSPNIQYSQIINSVATIGTRNTRSEYKNFEEILDTINTELLKYLSKNFTLTEDDYQEILSIYRRKSSTLNQDSFNQLVDLNKKHLSYNRTSIFSRNNIDGINNFDVVLSNNVCEVIGIFNSFLVKSKTSSLFVKTGTSELCPYLLEDAIRPIVLELKKRAIVEDYQVTEINIENEIKEQIIQLATAETSSSMNTKKEFIRRINWGIFGKKNHTASIEMEAHSRTKVGFDLAQSFTVMVDNSQQSINIILPHPKILSHEVDFKMLGMNDESWFIELNADNINSVTQELKSTLYKEGA